MEKSDLRKYSKSIRNNLPVLEYSEIICGKLKSLELYRKAKNILIYSSFSSEISTKHLLNEDKKIFLPRISGEELEICSYEGINNCQLNKYGILEPTTEKITDYSNLEIALIPALCASKSGYRLGYGKGYYDRFIPNLSKSCLKILLLPEELIFDNIPTEAHDTRADIIITQRNVIFI